MVAVLNIAVSLTISTGNVSDKQIADIDEINQKEIVSEIQAEYCITNIPSALLVNSPTEDEVFIKDSNKYILLK